MHAAASAKVVEHAENVWSSGEVVGVPFCLARSIREEVEAYETVAVVLHCAESAALGHSLPILDNPFWLFGGVVSCSLVGCDIVIVVVKICHDVGVAVGVVDTAWQRTFMERVYAVELRNTHHLLEVLVVYRSECAVALACGLEDVGACVAACPFAVVNDIALAETVDGVFVNAVGHLSAESRNNGLHAELAHALEHAAA